MSTPINGKFQRGRSGNPAGRPRGKRNTATQLREALGAELPSILEQLITQAKAGDLQACRLILERCLPALRPVELAQAVELPQGGSLSDQGRAVLSAVAAGELAPSQGAALLGALGQLAKIIETDELAQRVAALEVMQHGNA